MISNNNLRRYGGLRAEHLDKAKYCVPGLGNYAKINLIMF